MGYMGFGMRKEVYTRKPKTSFSKMKRIYGDHLEDFHKSKVVQNKWSDKDKEEFKAFFAKKIKRKNIIIKILKLIALLAIVSIIGLALYSQWILMF